jgi:hypothetical protein
VNQLAYLALLAWAPLGLLLFALLRPRTASAVVLLAGSLLLPIIVLPLPGPVQLGKHEAISLALLLGVLVFDARRIADYRPRVLDLVFLAWLAAGAASSLANDLGSYDAFTVVLNRSIEWGVPWFIGSLYFASRDGLRFATWAMFLSGVAYVPLCLWEVRMSPQLHTMVYGWAGLGFEQTMRGGGWRPTVFMAHGLELGLWMAAATVAGFVAWRYGRRRGPFGVPTAALLAGLAGTLVLCKSTGATLLGAIGMLAALRSTRRFSGQVLLFAIPVYIGLRIAGDGWVEQLLVDLSSGISTDRAGSLQFRYDNEVLLLRKVREHPMFGAGGWNFGVVVDPESGELIPITSDSFWIIAAATTGLFGLIASVGVLWFPAVRGLLASGTRRPERLGASLILAILVLDCMVNDFVPAFYVALAGGLAHVALERRAPAAFVSAVPLDVTAAAPRPNAARWLAPR